MENMEQPMHTEKSSMMVPIAIIIAGIIIAGAVVFTNKSQPAAIATTETRSANISPVTQDDFIIGSPTADIVLVEYSDTECPFCQQFHTTLHKMVETYGKDGKFAWVYRQLPFHQKSPYEAQSVLCAGQIGGQAKFWQYLDKLFSLKKFPTTQEEATRYVGIDPKELPNIAAGLGIDKTAFTTCLTSNKNEQQVLKDYNEAIDAGANGTPFSVIITKTGEQIPIKEGALPYANLKQVIDAVLNK